MNSHLFVYLTLIISTAISPSNAGRSSAGHSSKGQSSKELLRKYTKYAALSSRVNGLLRKSFPMLLEDAAKGVNIDLADEKLQEAVDSANQLLAEIRIVYPNTQLPSRIIGLLGKFDRRVVEIRAALAEAKKEHGEGGQHQEFPRHLPRKHHFRVTKLPPICIRGQANGFKGPYSPYVIRECMRLTDPDLYWKTYGEPH